MDELIDAMWNEWPDTTSDITKPASEFDNKTPEELQEMIHKMNDDQLYQLFERFCNLKHVHERVDKLEEGI